MQRRGYGPRAPWPAGVHVCHARATCRGPRCPPGKDASLVNPDAAQPHDPPDRGPGDTSERISALISDPLPREALAMNVEGRKVTAPDDGFGKLWRKRYWIRLVGSTVTPAELVAVWKARYTEFWPEGSRLYQPPDGL